MFKFWTHHVRITTIYTFDISDFWQLKLQLLKCSKFWRMALNPFRHNIARMARYTWKIWQSYVEVCLVICHCYTWKSYWKMYWDLVVGLVQYVGSGTTSDLKYGIKGPNKILNNAWNVHEVILGVIIERPGEKYVSYVPFQVKKG